MTSEPTTQQRSALDPVDVAFTVVGTPAMQGSKRHVGGGRMIEASKRTRPWRALVTDAAQQALNDGWDRLDGPVELRCVFAFDRPRGHYRTGRNAHLLRDTAPRHPETRSAGDLDKMVRLIADAVTDSGLWRDDSQVVQIRAEKVWAGENALGLGVPSAHVRVRAL